MSVRRVAQSLKAVERGGLGRVLGDIGIDDDDPATRRANPHHLAEHRRRIEEVVHREAGHDDREGAVGIRQALDLRPPAR
jgi:hypothetical protein